MGIKILEPEAPAPLTLDRASKGWWYLVHSPGREDDPRVVYYSDGHLFQLVDREGTCLVVADVVVPLNTLTVVCRLKPADLVFVRTK